MIIDANNSILGRVCSVAAKKALGGEEVVLVNCEKAIITGSKANIIARYMHRFELGQPTQGPFFPKRSDQFVRRVVRGMLPWKRAKGKAAYKKVKCFIEIPEEFHQKDLQKIDIAALKPSSTVKFMTVKEICRLIKG